MATIMEDVAANEVTFECIAIGNPPTIVFSWEAFRTSSSNNLPVPLSDNLNNVELITTIEGDSTVSTLTLVIRGQYRNPRCTADNGFTVSRIAPDQFTRFSPGR